MESESSNSSKSMNTEHAENSMVSIATDSRDSLDDFDMSSSAPCTKKRKIHMDSEQCEIHAVSEEGSCALTNPMQVRKSSKNVNKALYPRKPRQKGHPVAGTSPLVSKVTHPNNFSQDLSAIGFLSASVVHKQNDSRISLWQPEKDQRLTPKKRKELTGSNQRNITSFFNVKPSVSTCTLSQGQTSTSTHDNPTCSTVSVDHTSETNSGDSQNDQKCTAIQYGTPTKMYSPIKQLKSGSVIYVTSDSPNSSQDSAASPLPTCTNSDSVIKKLFDGQKSLNNMSAASKKKGKGIGKQYPSSKGKGKQIKSRPTPQQHRKINLVKQQQETEDQLNPSDDEILSSAVENASSQKFGLFGSREPNLYEADINYIDQLPDEVLQIIFCQLPMLDLCLNSNRVCRRWNNIISDEKFQKYKKYYHKLKKNVGGVYLEVQSCMLQNKMRVSSEFLTGIIRYAKTCHTLPASTNDSIVECLQKHKKYSWATSLIQERLPDLISQGVPNPWSLIATLVVISENVSDLQEVIKCLSTPYCKCTSSDLLECLYQIATFLYAFKLAKNTDIWNGMHYRLFYALYLYENSSLVSYKDIKGAASNLSGQQSLDRYSRGDCTVRLTHEQVRIVNHNCQPGEIIKIVAFAGTGKTTTLVRYTQMRPQMQFLLVVYNRSVCNDAKTKFPSNVTCKTGHGLSFTYTGRRYMGAGKMKFDLKVYTVSQLLPSRKGDNLFIRSKFVLDTLNNFMASDKEEILNEHVPNERMDENGQKVYVDIAKKDWYVKDAQYLWKKMIDLNDKDVPMTHDGYLKLYQLSKPKIWKFDCILIDEAQDLTPAITDILMSQSQTKILVGDPHQQIYAFRGAVNAMQQVTASHVFYLTQSFRFGPEIAQVAASCLEVLKDEKQKTLVGNGKSCKITGEAVGQVALLARCNFTLFNEAVKKCCYNDSDIKVAFVGGTNGFGFPMLMDIYTLMLSPEDRMKENRTIENKFIRKFNSLGELEKYASKTNDAELMGKIKIVRNYHHNLPILIRKILSKTIANLKTADMVFSTAHKAKGLEFSTVRLTDDFNVNPALQVLMRNHPLLMNALPPNLKEQQMDEGNLLYVAVTRAKHALQITPTLKSLLLHCGERFEVPISSSHLADTGVEFKCIETDATFEPCALTLQRKTIKLSTNEVLSGGLIGPDILSDNNSSLAELLGDPEKNRKIKEEREQKMTESYSNDDFQDDEDDDEILFVI